MKKLSVILCFFYCGIVSAQSISIDIQANRNKSLKNLLTGKVNFSKDTRFVKVPSNYCQNGKVIYTRKATCEAFLKMAKKAKQDGISLRIISGCRSFNHQKGIWERKWVSSKFQAPNATEKAKKILKYSSMPMTSRHHWGTDIDLNSLNNSYFEKGQGKKIYDWLVKNAPKYGFCQVYTDKKIAGRTGYEMEKWHWSYMPIARELLRDFNKNIDYSDIKGFKGSEQGKKLKVLEFYINGIHSCE